MTALITGGAGGIGSSAAGYFLEHGANVAVADVDKERLQQMEDEWGKYHANLLTIHDTIATPAGAGRIVEETIARFGSIRVLINNAAIVRDRLLARMSIDEFDDVVDTNMKGVFYCTKAVLPHMSVHDGGRIINMIAASGLSGNPGQTNYAAAKGGVLAMTLTWSAELRRNHITVNAVIPAAWTAMSGRIPQDILLKVAGEERLEKMKARKPMQVAPLLGFLASDEGAKVTGQCLAIAGTTLSVWGYAKPVAEIETESECWSEKELGQFLFSREDLRQTPGPSMI